MATSAATIFILRRRTRHLDGTGIYVMKLYPFMPVLFIITYIFVGIMIGVDNWRYAVTGISVFTAFLLLYFATKKFRTQTS
jgi:APA family basic amino acid/polyamine antiporter